MNIQGWMNVVQVFRVSAYPTILGCEMWDFCYCKVLKIQSIKLLSIGIGAIVSARIRLRTGTSKRLEAKGGAATFSGLLHRCIRTVPRGKSMMLKDFLHSARPCYPTTSGHIG